MGSNETGVRRTRVTRAPGKPSTRSHSAELRGPLPPTGRNGTRPKRAMLPLSASSKGVRFRSKPAGEYEYQKRILKDVLSAFKTSDRVLLDMASGLGKTNLAMFTAQALKAERIILLFPTLQLLHQTIVRWTNDVVKPLSANSLLAVCSDQTVGMGTDDIEELDDMLRPELPLLNGEAIQVTTDPSWVREFLRAPGQRIVFGTYQSSDKVAEAMLDKRVPDFDLAIADEAHWTASEKGDDAVMATIARLPSHPLRIRARKSLFATATPTFWERRDGLDDPVAISMDDECRFGRRVSYNFAWAIANGYLSDYVIKVIALTEEEAQELIERGGTGIRLDRDLSVGGDDSKPIIVKPETVVKQVGALKAIRELGISSGIFYLNRIRHSIALAKSIEELNERWLPESLRLEDLRVTHVDGTTPVSKRAPIVDELRHTNGKKRFVSNARCLIEGIDVPALDAVFIMEPRKSARDVAQAVGRALRKHGDKIGLVIVGAVLPPEAIRLIRKQDLQEDEAVAYAEELSKSDAWRQVLDVLEALRAHDARLDEVLTRMRRDLGANRYGTASRIDEPTATSVAATMQEILGVEDPVVKAVLKIASGVAKKSEATAAKSAPPSSDATRGTYDPRQNPDGRIVPRGSCYSQIVELLNVTQNGRVKNIEGVPRTKIDQVIQRVRENVQRLEEQGVSGEEAWDKAFFQTPDEAWFDKHVQFVGLDSENQSRVEMLVRAVRVASVRRVTDAFEEDRAAFNAWTEKHGRRPSFGSDDPDEVELAKWQSIQRRTLKPRRS